ncbi:ATP-binding protein [Flammeovirgaceae bacterium SG7u.111]|nr:ATP-binding protein [Flammeovirgaceae bacterium SG7u.132]WPO36900.1 ATP-binding protein [Flammeovirgaceae bacterium SG7u.111]
MDATFENLLNKWYTLTYFGVRDDMPYSLQKRTLLCNKLGMLALSLAIFSLPLLVFKLHSMYTATVITFTAVYLGLIPYLNKKRQVNFTRLSFSTFAPIMLLGYTLIKKIRHPYEIGVIDYFAPRALIFLTILLPLVLLDFKNIRQMTLGLGANILCLIFYDYWHTMFGVGYENMPFFTEGYFMINVIYVFAVLAIIGSFYFYQRTNDHFESENQKLFEAVKMKNRALREEQVKLTKTYEELKSSDDELRKNSEELQAINDNLTQYRDELKVSLLRERESREKLENINLELKHAQAQLIQSEKMASLGQLTAGVAHEINNPINFVYAGVSTLKTSIENFMQIINKYEKIDETIYNGKLVEVIEDIKLTKEHLSYDELKDDINLILGDISQGAIRTAEIVRGLRNFSRLDEEHLKMASINECLESTLVILKSQFKDHVHVVKEYEKELPEVNCYPGQLNQVFMNILNNAGQALHSEGTITIKTVNLNEYIQISIKDTGHGIPEDLKNKIFEPFYTTKDVGEGTGLGLSISYGIIEKHNGRIEVKSKMGEGSEFIIYISKNL